MRMNQRGSLNTSIPFLKSWRHDLRNRKYFLNNYFSLIICIGMVMITRDYASLRVEPEVHAAAVTFLAALPWLVLLMFRRRRNLLEGPLLTTIVWIGCLVLGKVWLSVNASATQSDQRSKLKTLSRATLEYASDHSETLPIANVWMDAISDRVTERDFTLGKNIFPQRDGYHVAMNSDFSSKATSKINRPEDRILYFISHKADRNANDALHSRIENTVCAKVSGSVTKLGNITSSKP
ncbi:hypothetical protein MCEMSE15_00673 [Fimbriimonadaceae bacterium]